VVCGVFSRTLQRSNHTGAHFLNRVAWFPRLLLIGLVALALIAMAPPKGSADDDEDPGASAIGILASRIDSSLRSRSTTERQHHEPDTDTKPLALTPGGAHTGNANFSWHGGRSTLQQFCSRRC
jgi:hypothetical protein